MLKEQTMGLPLSHERLSEGADTQERERERENESDRRRKESRRDGEEMRQSRASSCLCSLQMSTPLMRTYGARWAAPNSWHQPVSHL